MNTTSPSNELLRKLFWAAACPPLGVATAWANRSGPKPWRVAPGIVAFAALALAWKTPLMYFLLVITLGVISRMKARTPVITREWLPATASALLCVFLLSPGEKSNEAIAQTSVQPPRSSETSSPPSLQRRAWNKVEGSGEFASPPASAPVAKRRPTDIKTTIQSLPAGVTVSQALAVLGMPDNWDTKADLRSTYLHLERHMGYWDGSRTWVLIADISRESVPTVNYISAYNAKLVNVADPSENVDRGLGMPMEEHFVLGNEDEYSKREAMHKRPFHERAEKLPLLPSLRQVIDWIGGEPAIAYNNSSWGEHHKPQQWRLALYNADAGVADLSAPMPYVFVFENNPDSALYGQALWCEFHPNGYPAPEGGWTRLAMDNLPKHPRPSEVLRLDVPLAE